MLISCSSCNSKYLVNSADLKPEGRKVQCSKCGNIWYQTSIIENSDILNSPPSFNNDEIIKESKNKKVVTNLPSTYVEEAKPKIINSLMILILLFISLSFIWLLNSMGKDFLVLIEFYIGEFMFNFKLIINDIAKIIYNIIN